jgi:hypothetical protein
VFLPSYFLRGGIVFSHNGCIEQLLDDPNAMLPARAYRPPWISARCSKLLGSDGAGVYTLAAPNNVSSIPLNAHTEMQMTLLSLLTKMTHLRRRKHMLHPHLTKFSQVSALVYFQKVTSPSTLRICAHELDAPPACLAAAQTFSKVNTLIHLLCKSHQVESTWSRERLSRTCDQERDFQDFVPAQTSL